MELLKNPRGATHGKVPNKLKRARVCTSTQPRFWENPGWEKLLGQLRPSTRGWRSGGNSQEENSGATSSKPWIPAVQTQRDGMRYSLDLFTTGFNSLELNPRVLPEGKAFPRIFLAASPRCLLGFSPSLAALGNEFTPDLCRDSHPRKGVWHRQLQQVQPEVGIPDWSWRLLLALLSPGLWEPWDSFSFDSKPCFFALISD